MEAGFKACPFCAEPIREAATLCRYCNRTLGVPTSAAGASSRNALLKPVAIDPATKIVFRVLAICGACFLVVWLGFQIFENSRPPTPGASAGSTNPLSAVARAVVQAPRPVRQKLLAGNIEIAANQMRYATFAIRAGATNAQVNGEFQAFGGSGNDIQVVLTDVYDFENWKNNHPTNVLYNSNKVTNGVVTVQGIPAGQYVLAFDNRFSAFSRKQITGDITLSYTVP